MWVLDFVYPPYRAEPDGEVGRDAQSRRLPGAARRHRLPRVIVAQTSVRSPTWVPHFLENAPRLEENAGSQERSPTGVPDLHENTPPQDPTVGLRAGSTWGPLGGKAFSHGRGTPVHTSDAHTSMRSPIYDSWVVLEKKRVFKF